MLSVYDIPGSIFCGLIIWLIFSTRIRKYSYSHRKIYTKAIKLKFIYTLVFTLITAYYYEGGDSEMFLYAVRDMKQALIQKDISIYDLLLTEKVDYDSKLAYVFQQDDLKYPVYGFMGSESNFLVPKLGLIPFIVFFESYFAMCLVFSFFAFAGMTRLYKLFLYYFPKLSREMALATLFLPSVCYWSSGFLKDAICFASIGFLLYGIFNILIKRKHIASSLFWVTLSLYFLFTIKVYILLALIPGIGFWLFGHLGVGIKRPILKKTVVFVSLVVAAITGYIFIDYLTSDAALSKFSLDNIMETSSFSREIFERGGENRQGAYFDIQTNNPILLALNGLVATFFRPFPWEISSAIVMFSAMESLLFLGLVIYLIIKAGGITVFRAIFSQPILILCFTFSIIFALAVGMSATNFGSLSRYKIPCLPFYLIFILVSYRFNKVEFPIWMQRIFSWILKK